jgi:hypothetical protein
MKHSLFPSLFLLQENLGLLSANPASSTWKTYINYIDEMLLDGFFLAIECSLKYLLENTGTYQLMDMVYYWGDSTHSSCEVKVRCS